MLHQGSGRRRVAIAGSTGSIGTQGVEVIAQSPERFELVGVGANTSVELLAQQVNKFGLKCVALTDAERLPALRSLIGDDVNVIVGADAMVEMIAACEADVVLNAVVGFAGLGVTVAALQNNQLLCLANKESLVAAGDLVRKVLAHSSGELLPVDSEHGALHQCLRSETGSGAGDQRHVRKLIITASGGPFRGKSCDELQDVTAAQALAHPTWAMGPKISVDSSTLFNKGLEVIEAHVLFDIDYDDIEVTVHPQSILHSAVEFSDGSVIGQMSVPDMRLPIGYAMSHPTRLDVPYGVIDWKTLGSLTFEEPDYKTFRSLGLAFNAGRQGGSAPLWLNAANEIAVDAFLSGQIKWMQIAAIIEATLEQCPSTLGDTLEEIIASNDEARLAAQKMLTSLEEN